MSVILVATGLFGDKSYSVQVRPIFADGTAGAWGPTFAIINRPVENPPTMLPIGPSPAGVRVSWEGTLDPAYGEQWVLKKMDTAPTEANFDVSGVEIYRGSVFKSFDIDLNQEDIAYFAVTKMDKYGNRSTIDSESISFPAPTQPGAVTLKNSPDGFIVNTAAQTVSNSNVDKYRVVRVKYGSPFISYSVTAKSKSGFNATLTFSGAANLNVGDIVQVSISDGSFDGIFRVSSVTSSSITYVTQTSSTVNSTAASGLIIPTSSGPSNDGFEASRVEIRSGVSTEVTYTPEISGQKIYIAVGTEDYYRNRTSWQLLDSSNLPLSYGRNYIGQRDGITLTTNGNRVADSNWKYGYIGWQDVHHDTTKQINPTSSDKSLVVQAISTDSPDTIKIGVINSTTTLQFATAEANCDSRIYPSSINPNNTFNSNVLSKPILDNEFDPSDLLDGKNISTAKLWTDKYPSASNEERGSIWIECSASDILNDSASTILPIELSGTKSITGAFSVTPVVWGSVNDSPAATLNLWAVSGQWTPTGGGVYDPHFFPLIDSGSSMTALSSNTIVSRGSSGTTRTITMSGSETNSIVPNDFITVQTGDANYDGVWKVLTSSGASVTYTALSSLTSAATVTTGTVIKNYTDSAETFISKIGSWSISKNSGLGLFSGLLPQKVNYSWNWKAPATQDVNTLRLVWELVFEKKIFDESSSWRAGTEYSIKLGDFEAWPGLNRYADTGSPNDFSDPQTFSGGAYVKGSLTVDGTLDVIGPGRISAAGDLSVAGGATIDEDLTVSGNILASGAGLLNTGSILFYSQDYPITTTLATVSAGQERIINSLAAANDLTSFVDLGATSLLYVLSWTGGWTWTADSAYVGESVLFKLYRWTGSTWAHVRSTVGRTDDTGLGASIVHMANMTLATGTERPEFAVTAQPTNPSSTLLIKNSWTGGTPYTTPINRMTLMAIPYTRNSEPTVKAPNLSSLSLASYPTDTPPSQGSGGTTTKHAVIELDGGGWKSSYKGDGTTNSYAGGDLNQGFYSSLNGNQKSVWGFAGFQWKKEPGSDNANSNNVKAGSVKIVWATMTARATHWYSSSGGTMVLGTHTTDRTLEQGAPANWSNLDNKQPDRQRVDYAGTNSKTFDLNLGIAKDIWNGHVRANNDFGMGASANTNIDDIGLGVKGLIFGPGPTTGSKFYGSFDRSAFKIRMRVEWKE